MQTITSWRQFETRVRQKGGELLAQLDRFPNTILVAGCQRSGTTALSRIITQSVGMKNYWFGHDDELDAALILSGHISHKAKGRYCFQTTYLNNSLSEYYLHNDYRLIWILRTPDSVVYSMLHNWRTAALNRLFRTCGAALLDDTERRRYDRIGIMAISRIRRACLSYNAKVSQIFELRRILDSNRLLILDYDDLVKNKIQILPRVYKFIDLPYREKYSHKLHVKSINKAKYFSRHNAALVESSCIPIYLEAKKYLSVIVGNNASPNKM